MIIDCFPFYNEFDLLEIRLNELNDVVDYFVLSEANLTFSAKLKRFNFDEERRRFEKFKDKIMYLKIDTYPRKTLHQLRKMDRYQKQMGVNYCQSKLKPTKDDVVILSDIDEIPRAEAIKKAVSDKDWKCKALVMDLFYYYMNCKCTSSIWKFGRIIRPERTIKLRHIRGKKSAYDSVLLDAGWHFSFLGDIKDKLDAYMHQEYNKPPYNTQYYIDEKKNAGKDLFGRDKRFRFEFVSDLDYLPQYVKDNIDKFKQYIKK